MRIASLLATFVLLLSSCACVPAATAEAREPVQLQSGEHYWHALRLGLIRNVRERRNELVGEIVRAHGDCCDRFRIKKNLVENEEAKRKGTINAVRQLIWAMKGNSDLGVQPKFLEGHRKRLTRLTAVDLENAEKWQFWFEQNQDYLHWSDRLDHLVVDVEAKKAAVATEKYRQTHPWPQPR